MDSETKIDSVSIMNLHDVKIEIIKDEPSDTNTETLSECTQTTEVESTDDINADIVTYLDVTLENDSDENNELYDSDLDDGEYDGTMVTKLPFTCEICERGFRTYRSLQVHSSVHMKNNEFRNTSTCTICHKKFETRKLTYHFRKHNVAKSYQCFYCNCTYFTQSHLDEHIRTHTGYICNKCNISFEKESDLKSHYKTHVEDYLYACSICDQTFPTTANLSRHVSAHKKKRKLDHYS